MKLKEFKKQVDSLYRKCGDVDIIFHIAIDKKYDITFYDKGNKVDISNIDKALVKAKMSLDSLVVEDITTIQPTYTDLSKRQVNGVVISNWWE